MACFVSVALAKWPGKVSWLWLMLAILSVNQTEGRKKSESDSPVCAVCDVRRCALVSSDNCGGQIVKDDCGCCPVCDMAGHVKPAGHAPNDACSTVQCPKPTTCVLNIQGLPICKCPTPVWCRQVGRRQRQQICGSDGVTYKSECHFQVAQCLAERKLTVKYAGSCKSPSEDAGHTSGGRLIMSEASIASETPAKAERRIVGVAPSRRLSQLEKEARKQRQREYKAHSEREDSRREKHKERRRERQQERRKRRKRRLSSKRFSN